MFPFQSILLKTGATGTGGTAIYRGNGPWYLPLEMGNQHGGIIIGRFMPPHMGHKYLVDFARGYAGSVTVFVCTLSHEPIPGELRYEWMKHLVPEAEVVHITEEIPAASRDNDGAYAIWADAIRKRINHSPAYVFASESYGSPLASELGAVFVPVDTQRNTFPISAGMIRENPYKNWQFVPPVVRPYYARKVVALDKTGELGRELAAQFETVYASDYPAYISQLSPGLPTISGVAAALHAQLASEAALTPHANRFLVTGVDPLFVIDETTIHGDDAWAGLQKAHGNRVRPDLILSLVEPGASYVTRCREEDWPRVHQVSSVTEAVEIIDAWLAALTKN